MLYQLFNRSNLSSSFHVRKPPKQVGSKRHLIAQFATKQPVQRLIQELAHQVQTSELQGSVQLCTIIVEARGRIADLEAQGFQFKGIVTNWIRL